jgi:hypothetical protein
MRENRTYGSEGGEAKAFPTPITWAAMTPWARHDNGMGGLPCAHELFYARRLI